MNGTIVPINNVTPTESANARLGHRASVDGVLQRRVEVMASSVSAAFGWAAVYDRPLPTPALLCRRKCRRPGAG